LQKRQNVLKRYWIYDDGKNDRQKMAGEDTDHGERGKVWDKGFVLAVKERR
jgi:hypothetical protein